MRYPTKSFKGITEARDQNILLLPPKIPENMQNNLLHFHFIQKFFTVPVEGSKALSRDEIKSNHYGYNKIKLLSSLLFWNSVWWSSVAGVLPLLLLELISAQRPCFLPNGCAPATFPLGRSWPYCLDLGIDGLACDLYLGVLPLFPSL